MAVTEMQMQQSIQRIFKYAIKLRPKNTTCAYKRAQEDFMIWCEEKGFPSETKCDTRKTSSILQGSIVGRKRIK